MKKILLSVLKKAAPVLLLSTAIQASAAAVTTLHTGYGSGSLNGVAFENAAFAITTISDTSTISSCGTDCLFNINLSSSIVLDLPVGGGFLNFNSSTIYVSNGSDITLGSGDTQLLSGPSGDPWDMASSIEPRIGTAQFFQWPGIDTSGGLLIFNAGSVVGATFTATAEVSNVPIPAGVWLFGSGLVGLVSVARRKSA